MFLKTLKSSSTPANGFKRQAGFTLIELLISTTIMILLVGTGIANFIDFNDAQRLENSSKNLQNYLKIAQSKARLGDRPDACDKLEYYAVQTEAGSNKLNLVAGCANGEYQVDSTILDGVSEVVVNGEPMNMQFRVLHGGVDNYGTVNVYTSDPTVNQVFTVGPGGAVSELGDAYGPEPTPGINRTINTTQNSTSSPTPTPTPTPTPAPTVFEVILNTGSGLSCTQLCQQNNFPSCVSVGQDAEASDSSIWQVKSQTACSNFTRTDCTITYSCGTNLNGSCSSVMTYNTGEKALTCNGHMVDWTYCKCAR